MGEVGEGVLAAADRGGGGDGEELPEDEQNLSAWKKKIIAL